MSPKNMYGGGFDNLHYFLIYCEDEMEIKGERTKTYTSTPKNQVGTDKDYKALWGNSAVPLRTVTAHNNGNCVYVAKNGNDGNAGTSALPKLTIQNAITTAIGAGKSIVTVERNGYIGNIVFTFQITLANLFINANMTLQVEANENAILQYKTINTYQDNPVFYVSNINSGSYTKSMQLLNNRILIFGTAVGAKHSDDNGANWSANTLAGTGHYDMLQLSGGRVIVSLNSLGIKYSDDNGATWSNSNVITGSWYVLLKTITNRIIVGGSTTGIKYSDDNGATWSNSNITTGSHHKFIITKTGRIIAGGLSAGIKYSDDNGATWYVTNLTIDYANSLTLLTNNRILVTTLTGVKYSDDNGLNWITLNSAFGSWDTIFYAANNRLIGVYSTGGIGSGIKYSDDNGATWSNSNVITSFSNNNGNVYLNNGKIIVSNYYSLDNGLTYISYSNTYILYLNLMSNNRIIAGSIGTGIGYSDDDSLFQINSGYAINLNGFILEGNNKKVILSENINLYWCKIQNGYAGLINTNTSSFVKNCIFNNLYNGCVSKNGDYEENLFYNITNFAVQLDLNTTTFTFKHNTIYLSYIGLLIEGTISGAYTLENNLIHKCTSYPISSIVTQLTVLNSILYGQLFNVLSGVQTIAGILNPLFRSEDFIRLTQDFRIQVVEDNYSKDSLAKQNANDNFGGYTYDSGAFLITRVLSTDTFGLDIIPDFDFYDLNKSFVLMNFQQKDTASGDVSKYYDGYRLELTYTQKKGTDGSDLLTSQIMRLMKSSKSMRLIPHSAGIKSGVGSFNATLLTLTLASDTFVGRDKTTAVIDLYEGWGIKIVANATTYYFRITSHTATVITLENVEGYTGMANNAAAAYAIEFLPVKCVNPSTEFASEVAGDGWTNKGFSFNDKERKDTGHNLKLIQTRWC